MLTVLLVLQIIVTVSMIIVILIQRSSSDGMAGLAGGGGNSLMSGRAQANLLTRITSILAAIFIINSLAMAAISARAGKSEKSIIDDIQIEQKAPSAPIADKPLENAPATNAPAKVTPKTGVEENKIAPEAKKETKPAVPIAE